MATSEELLPLVLKQAQDHAMVLTDPSGTIIGWLAAAEHVFGYTADEVVGQNLAILFTPEDRDRGVPKHEMTVASADGRSEDDRWQLRKDGVRFWAGGVLNPLRNDSGDIVGYAKVLRDRTDVRAQIESLINTVERQKVFMGFLAHELRNSLAPISNAVKVISINPATVDLAPSIQIIERQVGFMRRWVDDLMDVISLGAGKVNLRFEVVHLEQILKLAAESCRPEAERRRHTLKVLVLPTRTLIWSDPDRLQQVVVNLLNNANKYTPDGGEIWLKATVEGHEAVFRVEDTGAGIEPKMLPIIFDLFTQEKESLDRAQGGIGLGLPLVKDLVTMLGGSVQVRSEGRGRGSEFTVRLPLYFEEGNQNS